MNRLANMNNFYSKLVKSRYPYIIAEIGANHNGDVGLAKKLIDTAKSCGADAAKFQSWAPDSVVSKEEFDRNTSYNDGDGGKKHFGSLREMVEKYYLNESQHSELKEHCDKIGIDFCSTPFSTEEADMLNKFDIPFYKIASMDINNHQLLKYVAQFKKPVILSTGMATLSEISAAIDLIESQGNEEIILLHCISIYPPKYQDINLNNIEMLRKTFGYPAGFSDHSIGTAIPLAATTLGACVIEKHFTLDKDMPGWDHAISADPAELKIIVDESRNIVDALGNYRRTVSDDEEAKKLKFRRSAVANKQLFKDHIIERGDIDFKRPGTGIPPDKIDTLVGRRLKIDLDHDELFKPEHFE